MSQKCWSRPASIKKNRYKKKMNFTHLINRLQVKMYIVICFVYISNSCWLFLLLASTCSLLAAASSVLSVLPLPFLFYFFQILCANADTLSLKNIYSSCILNQISNLTWVQFFFFCFTFALKTPNTDMISSHMQIFFLYIS